MLWIQQAKSHQLQALLKQPKQLEIDGLQLPEGEAIAPHFLLESTLAELSQDCSNEFWWSPRLIVVDQLIVGMGGFKGPPNDTGTVEIGYGIVPSQQRNSFATQAIHLLVQEGFSCPEVSVIVAHTTPSNMASWRVLEKNKFAKVDIKVNPEDGEVWLWKRTRSMNIRNIRSDDYHPIITILNEWWGGRQMSDMLPKLFFVHFSETSFVMESEGEIVGFLIGFLSQSHAHEAYIHFAGVHPKFRKQGVGRTLYAKFFEMVRMRDRTQVRCVTSPVNKQSIAYHLRLGFHAEPSDAQEGGVPYHRDYDGVGEHRVLLIKHL